MEVRARIALAEQSEPKAKHGSCLSTGSGSTRAGSRDRPASAGRILPRSSSPAGALGREDAAAKTEFGSVTCPSAPHATIICWERSCWPCINPIAPRRD